MSAAVRTSGGDPVVVGFFKTLKGPGPRLEALLRILGHLSKIRPVGTTCLGLVHVRLQLRQKLRRNSNRVRMTAKLMIQREGRISHECPCGVDSVRVASQACG